MSSKFCRVYQNKFGFPDGNCFAACVASILGIHSVDAVPNFCAKGTDDWSIDVQRWLNERGWAIVWMSIESMDKQQFSIGQGWWPADMPYIVSGKGPRGLHHSVVYQGAGLLHDPHPDGGGVEFDGPIPAELIFKMTT